MSTAVSETPPAYLVPAVVSAARVLTYLAHREGEAPTQAELARELGLSKSTAFNLLVTLEYLGLVQRDRASRRYRLGAALVPLGQAAARHSRIAALAAERLPALARELGLSFALFQVTDDGHAQAIARAYPPDDIHVGITLGSVHGPFDGAVGKCLLAGLDSAEAERRVKAARLPRHTSRTVTDRRRLLRQVAEIRRQGWASSVGELNDNNAVAAPVLGTSGRAELFLLALGFSDQIPEARVPELGARLRATADAVTAAAGGRPATLLEINTPTGPERAQETMRA
ncbi:MAG TPA: IclR family transcriptional regulator [Solirubrobacteraceae bacterium]|nr:IclR family transcriptional regulator [Solirubrobacteraceae bacterium]